MSHVVTIPSSNRIVIPATINELIVTTVRSNFKCFFRSIFSNGFRFSRIWKIPPAARRSEPETNIDMAIVSSTNELNLSNIPTISIYWISKYKHAGWRGKQRVPSDSYYLISGFFTYFKGYAKVSVITCYGSTHGYFVLLYMWISNYVNCHKDSC